ncbi:MAG: DNA polymerase III subunit beta [Eubacterium sp.]|nr:DNA polymerase III subunit beta [Eubacterium sp.]
MLKFSVMKSDIIDALMTTAKAASSKSVISALEGILLSLKKNTLTVTGYDLEIGIKTDVTVKGSGDGELVMNSRLICDMVRKMPDGEISFEETDNFSLNISCGDIKYSVKGIDSKDYPLIPELSRGESFEISEPLLKSMIGQTLYAVSTIDTKPVLMGSKFDIKENNINVISVDGIRIALRKETLLHEDFDFVVPGKTLSEMLRLLSDDESKIAVISVDRNQCIFKIEKYTVFSRLLEGDFFDYSKIVGYKSEKEAIVNVREMMDCVERTMLLINEKFRASVNLTFDDNILEINCETPIGKINQKIAIEYSAEKTEISFNGKYLLDALRNTGCDKVKFYILSTGVQALKILPPEGESFMFLVSPMRKR